MNQVTQELTRKVANLARLDLTEEEVKVFTEQLQQILEFVGQIATVDTNGVEPMVHPHDYQLLLRPDQPDAPFLDAEGKPKVLESAPEVLFDGYKVPQIL